MLTQAKNHRAAGCRVAALPATATWGASTCTTSRPSDSSSSVIYALPSPPKHTKNKVVTCAIEKASWVGCLFCFAVHRPQLHPTAKQLRGSVELPLPYLGQLLGFAETDYHRFVRVFGMSFVSGGRRLVPQGSHVAIRSDNGVLEPLFNCWCAKSGLRPKRIIYLICILCIRYTAYCKMPGAIWAATLGPLKFVFHCYKEFWSWRCYHFL